MPEHRLPVHHSCFVPLVWFRFSRASLCGLLTGTSLSSDFTLTTLTGIWSHFWDSDWQPIPSLASNVSLDSKESSPQPHLSSRAVFSLIPNRGPLCGHAPSHLCVWISSTGRIETLIPPASLLLLPSANYPRTIESLIKGILLFHTY